MSSGIFRMRETEVSGDFMTMRQKYAEIIFYEDAPDATVSVERNTAADNTVNLRINGKVDASSRGDLSTQVLIGHLPIMMRPNSEDVFVVGLGSGITSGAVLTHPIKKITVAENCEPVVRAARFFQQWNGNLLDDKRAEICDEDARTVLKLSPQQYDVIISQPSNPWLVGIGSVFSREFYQLAAQRLKPGGIISQWFHVYEINDPIVFLVMRTFGEVFPHFEIWDAGHGDLVLIGSREPFVSNLSTARRIFERSAVKKQFEDIGLTTPEMVFARQLASQRTAFAIPGPGPIQTDLFPILEYEAPKAFYLAKNAELLFEFDERTWQHDLAATEKREALSTLSTSNLQQIFGTYISINYNLMRYLALRFSDNDPTVLVQVNQAVMPCIFRPGDAPAPPIAPTEKPGDLMAQLAQAEAFLASTNQLSGLRQIEAILRAAPKETDRNTLLSNYAVFGAQRSIRRGDLVMAKNLLREGLRVSPDSPQLNYLARVLTRVTVSTSEVASTEEKPDTSRD